MVEKANTKAIIADDLTGANDCGVQFSEKGYDTTVYFNEEISDLENTKEEIKIYDTDTRAVIAKKAYNVVSDIGEKLMDSGVTVIQKKIDSTLRGNIGIETKALLDTGRYDIALIVPGHPSLGRQTINGIHYVHKKELMNTEFIDCLNNFENTSNVMSIIEHQIKEKVGFINTKNLGTDIASWKEEINKILSNGLRYAVCDVIEEKDLENIVNIISSINLSVLWVGSAGVTKYLSRICECSKENQKRNVVSDKPALVVSGTRAIATKKQIAYITREKDIKIIKLPVQKITNEKKLWTNTKESLINIISNILNENYSVILSIETLEGEVIDKDFHLISNKITKRLGEIVKEVVKDKDIGLILTGGDTAKAVCKSLGGKGIKLSHELEEGLPVGSLIANKKHIPLVTKAGGFGKDYTLLNAINFVRGGDKSWANQS